MILILLMYLYSSDKLPFSNFTSSEAFFMKDDLLPKRLKILSMICLQSIQGRQKNMASALRKLLGAILHEDLIARSVWGSSS